MAMPARSLGIFGKTGIEAGFTLASIEHRLCIQNPERTRLALSPLQAALTAFGPCEVWPCTSADADVRFGNKAKRRDRFSRPAFFSFTLQKIFQIATRHDAAASDKPAWQLAIFDQREDFGTA